ncbi:pantetheine-phosphate adenylyltransferase [Coprinopsis cinerea AmutBmut pab1-1]|nr:pantetheine-phosphate adenylyltransferase [Coprinopsis cinerea AmutBmut pab1-1]
MSISTESFNQALVLATLPTLSPPHFLSPVIHTATALTKERLVIVLFSRFFNVIPLEAVSTTNQDANDESVKGHRRRLSYPEKQAISHTDETNFNAVQRLLTFVYVQATKTAQEHGKILMDIVVLLKGFNEDLFNDTSFVEGVGKPEIVFRVSGDSIPTPLPPSLSTLRTSYLASGDLHPEPHLSSSSYAHLTRVETPLDENIAHEASAVPSVSPSPSPAPKTNGQSAATTTGDPTSEPDSTSSGEVLPGLSNLPVAGTNGSAETGAPSTASDSLTTINVCPSSPHPTHEQISAVNVAHEESKSSPRLHAHSAHSPSPLSSSFKDSSASPSNAPPSPTSPRHIKLKLKPHRPPFYPVVALGGTFDHLHAGHKILLSMGAWIASRKVIVGVTSDTLLKNKPHAHLIQPLSLRISHVKQFLQLFKKGLEYDVVEISDVYGPTGWDPDVQALVISRETKKGGEMVATHRASQNLPPLETFVIDVISATEESLDHDDAVWLGKNKLSSTFIRGWVDERKKKEKEGL